jgi:hypothetical protein
MSGADFRPDDEAYELAFVNRDEAFLKFVEHSTWNESIGKTSGVPFMMMAPQVRVCARDCCCLG